MMLLTITLLIMMICSFFGLSFYYHAAVWFLSLSVMSMLSGQISMGHILLWSMLMLVFGISPFRRRVVTSWLWRFFKYKAPKMSETERSTLMLGDQWLEQGIFLGRIDLEALSKLKPMTLNEQDRLFLRTKATAFCQMLDDWQIRRKLNDCSKKQWKMMRNEGFFALEMDQEVGGAGLSLSGHAAVIKTIAAQSITAAITVMVPNSLGPAELIEHYGTQDQKDRILPKLANGQWLPCFALTESRHGSDATNIKASGVVIKQSNGQLGIKLNFAKRYITLGPIADIIGLAFHAYDPDGLLSDQYDLGITLALIQGNAKGLKRGKRHDPMGVPFINGPIEGKDVMITFDEIIGGQQAIGQGWSMLVSCLATGRAISLPAVAASQAALATLVASAYGQVREQFAMPIAKFQAIAYPLSSMALDTVTIEALRSMTLQAVCQGKKPAVASAMAKYHSTQMARQIVTHCMDILGGKAIMQGPMNPLGSCYASLPIGITVEGANILTRSMILFGQGSMHCHPFIKEQVECLQRQDGNVLKTFDTLIWGHMKYFLQVNIRAIFHGLTAGLGVMHPLRSFISQDAKINRILRRQMRCMMRLSIIFSVLSEWALVLLGGELKRQELISGSLGDVMSHLYMAMAVFWQLEHASDHNTLAQVSTLAIQKQLFLAQQAIVEVKSRMPYRRLLSPLFALFMPYGSMVGMPTDGDMLKLANAMSNNHPLRQWMQDHIGQAPEGTARHDLETCFKQKNKLEPWLKSMKSAIKSRKIPSDLPFNDQLVHALELGLIDHSIHDQLKAYDALLSRVVATDAF